MLGQRKYKIGDRPVSPHSYHRHGYFEKLREEGLVGTRSPGGQNYELARAAREGVPVCGPGQVLSYHRNGNVVAPHCVRRAVASPMPRQFEYTPGSFAANAGEPKTLYELGDRCRKGYTRSRSGKSYGKCVKSKRSGAKKSKKRKAGRR